MQRFINWIRRNRDAQSVDEREAFAGEDEDEPESSLNMEDEEACALFAAPGQHGRRSSLQMTVGRLGEPTSLLEQEAAAVFGHSSPSATRNIPPGEEWSLRVSFVSEIGEGEEETVRILTDEPIYAMIPRLTAPCVKVNAI